MNLRNRVTLPLAFFRPPQLTRPRSWMAMLPMLLSPNLSFLPPLPIISVQPTPYKIVQTQVQGPVDLRDRIQAEVDQAFNQTFTLLNLVLIVLLLVPTLTAVAAGVLLSKLVKQTALAQQEIESLKSDTLSQLEPIIYEAKTVLYNLQQQNAEVDQALEQLKTRSSLKLPQAIPTDSKQQSELGRDYAKQGEKFFLENRYEEAINAYDKALQLQPSLAEVWNNRGVVLTKLQRYHEAIASYEQAIQLRSDYSDAWNNRGVALGKLKYYEAAVLSYDRAIQLKDNYVDAWNNRGFALTQLKQYEAAITSYQKAEEINPDFYLIWYNKSRCYALQEKANLALESLEKAIKLKPNITRNLAKKETDFSAIQNEEKFQKLIYG